MCEGDFKKRLKEAKIDIKKDIFGFLDESALELDPKRRRFFGRRKMSMILKKRKATIFGFMSFNGKNVLMMSGKSKKEEFIAFLRLIRKRNPKKRIVILLDNAKIHWAKDSQKETNKLGIKMVFLPPYSPDLNPVEFLWKDLKRRLAKFLSFDEIVATASEVANDLILERRFSYAESWLKNFGTTIGLL